MNTIDLSYLNNGFQFVGALLADFGEQSHQAIGYDDFYEASLYRTNNDEHVVVLSNDVYRFKTLEPNTIIDTLGFSPSAKFIYEQLDIDACKSELLDKVDAEFQEKYFIVASERDLKTAVKPIYEHQMTALTFEIHRRPNGEVVYAEYVHAMKSYSKVEIYSEFDAHLHPFISKFL